MRKIVFLAGIAAAAFGAMKFLRGNKEEEAWGTEYQPEPKPPTEMAPQS